MTQPADLTDADLILRWQILAAKASAAPAGSDARRVRVRLADLLLDEWLGRRDSGMLAGGGRDG